MPEILSLIFFKVYSCINITKPRVCVLRSLGRNLETVSETTLEVDVAAVVCVTVVVGIVDVASVAAVVCVAVVVSLFDVVPVIVFK